MLISVTTLLSLKQAQETTYFVLCLNEFHGIFNYGNVLCFIILVLKLDTSKAENSKFGDLNFVTCSLQSDMRNKSIKWYRIQEDDEDIFHHIKPAEDKIFKVIDGVQAGMASSILQYHSQPQANGGIVCAIVPDDFLLAKQAQVTRGAFTDEGDIVYKSARIAYKSGEFEEFNHY